MIFAETNDIDKRSVTVITHFWITNERKTNLKKLPNPSIFNQTFILVSYLWYNIYRKSNDDKDHTFDQYL